MASRNFKEMIVAEVISMTGGIFAGSLLAIFIDKILIIPGLFIILPGFLEMRGNISGSLSGRLSTHLHLGTLQPYFKRGKILTENTIATFLLVLLVSFMLGIFALLTIYFIFHALVFEVLYVALLAGIISNIIEIPLTIMATFFIFRKGHDPNNVMGPYVTTTGDIVSIVSLLAAIALLTWI
ncbi:MAG: magnesium transporter [DPANN group archaeon]|nr:magnesium transporter [DPANN group archaeon]